MALPGAVDGLYGLPLGEFVAARDALARALRAEGDREAAAAVKKLAKPTVSAWAVNQLARRHEAAFAALEAAGDALRDTQRAVLAGRAPASALAPATAAQKVALSTLLRHAEVVLADAGHGASAATLRRVQATLEALAAWGAHREGPPAGRLAEDLDPPGFEALMALAASPPPAAQSGGDPAQQAEEARRRAERAAAEAALAEAEALRANRAADLQRAQVALERAESATKLRRVAAGEAARRASETRQAADQAAFAEAAARAEVARAREALAEAEAKARAARGALEA